MINRYSPYQYNRSNKSSLTHPPTNIPRPSPHVPNKKTHCPPKKKLNFKSLKKDTCTSLNDVEYFLNNFSNTLKYIKLIKLLK